MATYLGDIAEDATIAFLWDTVDGDGASVTRATDGTIKVRRLDDGTDATGTSVTDNEDTPLIGIHECIIDTSDNANFTTGDDYAVYLEAAVIDGQTVNAVLATFSIENRFSDSADDTVTALFAKTGITAGGAASFEDIMKAVYARAQGNINRSGDVFTFLDDDDATALFTLTIATLTRTTT